MRCTMRALAAGAALGVAAAQDPASSWLAYTVASGNGTRITFVNATWTVPTFPTNRNSPSAPGWWFGIEPCCTGNGGADELIQPILAYGDGQNRYTAFNGYYNWISGQWYQSASLDVAPGDVLYAQVSYASASNSYNMAITNLNKTGATVNTNIPVEYSKVYSDVYFVTEHQPDSCAEYPASGRIDFVDINVAWNGVPTTPSWTAAQFQPACNSLAFVDSPSHVHFTWATS